MNKVISKHLSKDKFVRKMNRDNQKQLQYQIGKNQERSLNANTKMNLRSQVQTAKFSESESKMSSTKGQKYDKYA